MAEPAVWLLPLLHPRPCREPCGPCLIPSESSQAPVRQGLLSLVTDGQTEAQKLSSSSRKSLDENQSVVTPVYSLLCHAAFGGLDPNSSWHCPVLSFPILKQRESSSRLAKPRRGWGDKRLASLGPLDPKGLAGPLGQERPLARQGRLHESAKPPHRSMPAQPHRQEQVCAGEAPGTCSGSGQQSLKHQSSWSEPSWADRDSAQRRQHLSQVTQPRLGQG